MIGEAGIYEMPAADYHDDPCPEPSLSSSIVKEILVKSPLHAWHAHPRLNPDFKREERDIFDLGSAAHAYLLEGEDGFVLIDAEDFRTKAAKEAREEARAAGKIPLLRSRWEDIIRMHEALSFQLAGHLATPRPFINGKPEQTIVWQDRGLIGEDPPVWCRARLDWLHDDLTTIDDYKSTQASANPEEWARGALFSSGADVQAAWYLRGYQAVTGKSATWRFVVQENYEPFAASVIGLTPGVLMLAEKKILLALEIWRRCITEGRYTAYPDRVCLAELPVYQETRWIEREIREGVTA